MILQAGKTKFSVHFWHQHLDDPELLWNAQTTCSVHRGKCANPSERPCRTRGTKIGITYCSKKDVFDKAKGRKHAFARAIESLSRETRSALWVSYLALFPPK